MTRDSLEGPPAQRSWVWIGLIVVLFTLMANAIGYLLYRESQRSKEPVVVQPVAKSDVAVKADAQAESKTPSGEDLKALAATQRERGIKALRDNDYELAISTLKLAMKLDPTLADGPALVELAEKLKKEAKEEPKPAAQEVKVAPVVRRPEPAQRTPAREVAVVQKPRTAEPTRAATGLLLVATTPTGLLVNVDGAPKDLSPLRLELDAGNHELQIVQGNRVVFSKTIEVAAGKTQVVNETFEQVAVAASAKVQLPVEDKAAKQPKTAEVAKESAARTAAPSLYIVAAGEAKATERSLASGMSGVEVRVFGSVSELKRAMGEAVPDAVLGPPGTPEQAGLRSAIVGSGKPGPSYTVASFGAPVATEQLAKLTIGAVDENGRKATEDRVQAAVGGAVKVRRVPKLEDLLPLLQFKMADAVILKSEQVPELRRRTAQELHTVVLPGARPSAAVVAFTEGGRRSVVERALVGLAPETRSRLGVEKWSIE